MEMKKLIFFFIFLVGGFCLEKNDPEGAWPLLVHLKGQGLAQGFQKQNLNLFLGIPYAQPPVEALRWKSTQKPLPFNGIFQASHFGDACTQSFPKDYTFPADQKFSENCLSLNVYAPNTPGKKPVFFWIHGGSFTHGGSSEFRLRAEYFAQSQDVIVVTINYRLGMIGFFANPLLRTENPEYQTTGNYGFLDQQRALEWVNENIYVFGGDPGNVTIGGESAGASSTCFHLLSHKSWPYFSKAIVESSACFGEMSNLTKAYDIGQNVVQLCNDSPNNLLECLRSKNALDIWKTYIIGSSTTVDNVVFQESSYNSIQKGDFAKVPVIIGDVLNEGTIFVYPKYQTPVGLTGYRAYLKEITAGHTQYAVAVEKEYPCSTNDCRPQMSKVFGDLILRCPTLLIADRISKEITQPIFSYTFSHAPSWSPPILGAYHSSDVSFVFSTIDYFNNTTPKELNLAHKTTEYWGNFIKTANPNSHNLYEWNNFAEDSKYWKLDLNLTISQMPDNYNQAICVKFWNPIFEVIYGSW